MDNEGDIFRRCERVGRLFAAIFLSSGWKPIVNIFGKKSGELPGVCYVKCSTS